ncbi:hypothetical protein [Pedobacter jejuensis]|uniref:Uncharacterized protein n=1 Tax=Pedobacter jejuensis TaxID=1268550 RepID=A0A3N0BX20_9SPHI|nr:hypothetical protein [Pedobacter jejuensis]RNL54283.1 hypothetical protein D7004_09350 [Pedobacter jejuensis]
MENQEIEFQAKMYAYAINSATKEYGFKKDEGWKLNLANAAEKLEIEQKYYPTVSTQIDSKSLLQLSELVKTVLNETPIFAKDPIHTFGAQHSDSEFIVAYNPIRVHR